MEAFKDFPEDFAKTLQTSLNLLYIFNIRYLEDDQPFLKKYWRFSYIIGTVFIHSLALIINLPEVLTGQDMTQFAQLMPSVLISIHAILKCIVLIPKTSQVSALIKELGSQWRVKFTMSQKKEKDRLLWRLNFINRASFWATVCGSMGYLLTPLFETLFRRFILKQDGQFLLPFVSCYPLNTTTNWIIYILLYILQLYSITLLVAMYMGAALLMTTSCALLGIEFLMLRHDLAEAKSEQNPERSNDVDTDDNEGSSIQSFVKRHQKLLRLSRQLDNVFNGMVFIDLLFVGITTCAFSFMLQFARDPGYMLVSYIGIASSMLSILYLCYYAELLTGAFARGPGYMLVSYIGIASSMLSILYLCYYAELLTGASASIGDTAYDNLWYKGGKHYKMAILLIIRISQKPCCLTSLKYTVVSMKMFTKVISTTWSYFSLMNSVYSSEE